MPSLCLSVSQTGLDTLLNQRPLELRHCANDLEHQPARGRAQVQIVAQADERYAVGDEIGEQQLQLRRMLARWERYYLIAFDEVGYVVMAEVAATAHSGIQALGSVPSASRQWRVLAH